MRGSELHDSSDGENAAKKWRLWLAVAGGAVAAFSLAAIALIYLVLKLAEPELPLGADLYALNRPSAYTFLDQQGETVGHRGAVVGERLKLRELPPYLPAAFLAMEDRRFYQHGGVDPRGLMRAAITDFKALRLVQGGSTITQQLVKILFLTPDRTLSRKLVEIAGAWKLERLLSKDQILELYLNRIYLGAGSYGVDGAARLYFGKSARDVTLQEAAMLAGLTNAPSLYSPRRDLPTSQKHADLVLTALVTYGTVKEDDVGRARLHPATIVEPNGDLARDYFLDAAIEEARHLVPSAGDVSVVTTLDTATQEAARAAIANVMSKRGPALGAHQAALVAMSPDGAVRALMGGKDYSESSFNRVTKAHRAPGSAFKPVVYLAALERGLTRDTIRVDEPITIKDWSPDNYTEGHVGPVTLEDALARSINTVAVELGQEVGLPTVVATARRLGVNSPLQPNASLALGTSEVTPLEMTAAYASFASLGVQAVPYTVTEIRSANGAVLYSRAPATPVRVMAAENALAMNAMLYEVVQSGTGRAAAVPGREVAGKTGTSAEYRDAWFIGFSPQLVTGVWVGNDDFTPTKRVTGGTLPAQIWSGFMRTALKNTPTTVLPRAEPLEQPAIAESGEQGEGFFDRLGDFFGRLFGGNRNAQPRRPRGWVRSSDNSWHYVPDEDRQQFAAGEDQHGRNSNSPIPNRQFYAQAPENNQQLDPYARDQQRYAYRSEHPRYAYPGDNEYQRAQPHYDSTPNDGYGADQRRYAPNQRRYAPNMSDRRADMPYPYFSDSVP
jgi:penicillin-binding protein 1A